LIYKKVLENMNNFFLCIKLKNNDYIFPEEENKIKELETFLNECILIDDLLFYEKENKWYEKKVNKIIDNNILYFIEEYRDVTCFKEKEELLKIDFVTGLSIRKVVIEKIDSILNESNNNILVLGDIDYFKRINDTYGHDIGDFVLKQIGSILKKYTSKDIVGRFGGEEFILFFYEKDEKEVLEILNDIKYELRQIKLDDYNIGINMSFGYTINNINKPFELLFKEADQALYYAKENGRNKIICYDDIIVSKKDEA